MIPLSFLNRIKGSFFLYSISLASYFLVDIYISKNFENSEVANWAYLKSILFLSAAIVLLGMDKSVIKHPGFVKKYSKWLIIQIPVLAGFVSILFYFIKSEMSFIGIFFPVLLLSILMAVQAIYRSFAKFTLAQMSSNGWKFVFFVIVGILNEVFGVVALSESIIVSMIVVVFFILFIELNTKKIRRLSLEYSKVDSNIAFRDGFLFLFHAVLFNLTISIEQIILNQQGMVDESALLFAHMAVFLPLIVALNGFSGFLIGPIVRKRGFILVNEFYSILKRYTFVGIILLLVSYFIGDFLFKYFFENKFEFDIKICAFVLLIGGLRYLYVIPSSIIGMLGDSSVLKRSLIYYFFGALIYVSVLSVLLYLQYDTFNAILISSIINWFLRVGFGFILSYAELRPNEV